MKDKTQYLDIEKVLDENGNIKGFIYKLNESYLEFFDDIIQEEYNKKFDNVLMNESKTLYGKINM
jgi:hypothetical protein